MLSTALTALLRCVAFAAMIGATATLGFAATTAPVPGDMFTDPKDGLAIQNALLEIVRWTYRIMYALATIILLYRLWEMNEGEVKKGGWAIVSAVAMFLTAAIMQIALNIGKTAAGAN